MKTRAKIVGISFFITFAAFTAAANQGMLVAVDWPGIQKVWKYETAYLSSNPTDEGLAHAKSQGVATVVNLMEDWEMAAPGPEFSEWISGFLKGGGVGESLQLSILLSEPSLEWNEAQAARELGLRYEHIPLSVENPDPEAVNRFLQVMKEIDAKQVLVHCDLAGRALATWAIYLGMVKGYSPESALAEAKAAGLNHEGLENFALSYLQKYAG